MMAFAVENAEVAMYQSLAEVCRIAEDAETEKRLHSGFRHKSAPRLIRFRTRLHPRHVAQWQLNRKV